jgi:hypothetical protein
VTGNCDGACDIGKSLSVGEKTRPLPPSGPAEAGDMRPKSLADHCDFARGEVDLAVLFLSRFAGAVLRRRGCLGIAGGARGARNLSLGFMVL